MKKVFFAAACAAMVMVSCNNASKEIDQNIDKFEAAVNEYCAAMESGDMAAAEATTAKFQEIGEALKDSTIMSEEQKQRLKALGMKMAEASIAAIQQGADALEEATDEFEEVVEEAAEDALEDAVEE
ncbi:MAG: hypothetical protein MJZ35_06010 [Bacteroidaceae bacterium]|nr:hypothetical protein [Bacteroidaceae bacterium]